MKKVIYGIFIAMVCVMILSFSLSFGLNKDNDNGQNDTQQVNFSELTYVAFGDSITYGLDTTRNGEQMDTPYPTAVGQILKLKSTKNFGVSGAPLSIDNPYDQSIANVVSRFGAPADIISIMGGVNDYHYNVEIGSIDDTVTDTFYGSLNHICEYLSEKYSNSFVFFMTPYKECMYTEKNACDYVLEDYANAVKTVCQKYNYPVLDMYNNGQFDLEMHNYGSDGLHPSQNFVLNYTAPQIAQFIRNNYKK